ncbi:unnamed protein product [Linum tenue]|uniref:Membrane insertase YidC/Oxa/ALB C-terminal domain-containing protein n=1 Tax=Linum tenue TaxID=586396 RepID=A0AAV0M4C8_9ROSI|nr:unnamed protein product [Linum tenue]
MSSHAARRSSTLNFPRLICWPGLQFNSPSPNLLSSKAAKQLAAKNANLRFCSALSVKIVIQLLRLNVQGFRNGSVYDCGFLTVSRRKFSFVLPWLNFEASAVDGRPSQKGMGNVHQHRFFGNCYGNTTALGLYQGIRRSGFLLPSIIGPSSARYMSTAIGESSDKIELISDVTEVLTETPIEAVASQAAGVSEVAVAAADSFLPIKVLQHCVDAVHTFTGCNWFLSIVLTTLILKTATLPFLIIHLKSNIKLFLLRPQLEQIEKVIRDESAEPEAIHEGQKTIEKLYEEHGITPFTTWKWYFIQGPVSVCFFLAIQNMAEKVPSFKNGGAYWFTDLTTPDSMYLLPFLIGLGYLTSVEVWRHLSEGLEGNPIPGTSKTISRVLAVGLGPISASCPTAICGYWLTYSSFSVLCGLATKLSAVKKLLGYPEIAMPPTATTATQAPFNLFSTPKLDEEMEEEVPSVSSDESSSSAKTSSCRASSSCKE